jgi:hypothetical protein
LPTGHLFDTSMRYMKTKLGLGMSILIVAALLSILSSMREVSAQEGGTGVDVMRRGGGSIPHIFAPKGGFRSTNKNLIDHGGPVLPTSHVYAIYWGPVPSDISDALNSFFTGFGGSSYANILTQYMRGVPPAPPASTYTSLAPDPSAPPTHAPSVNTIVNEACASLGGTAPDPDGVYFVIPSNFPKGANYCAWHSYGTCNGHPIAVGYLPNVTSVSGCDITSLSANPFGNGGQSIANVAAHELSESITDQLVSAWYDSSGQEVGDKCAWQFSSPVTLSNGIEWQLQEEWSNSNSGCVQSIP